MGMPLGQVTPSLGVLCPMAVRTHQTPWGAVSSVLGRLRLPRVCGKVHALIFVPYALLGIAGQTPGESGPSKSLIFPLFPQFAGPTAKRASPLRLQVEFTKGDQPAEAQSLG